MPGHKYVEEIGLAAMLVNKKLASVGPEANLRENVAHTPLSSTNKTAHSDFETQRRNHQKGYKGPHKKDLCPPKILKNKMNYRKISGCVRITQK